MASYFGSLGFTASAGVDVVDGVAGSEVVVCGLSLLSTEDVSDEVFSF